MVNLKKVVFGLSLLLSFVVLSFSAYIIYIAKIKQMMTFKDIDPSSYIVQKLYNEIHTTVSSEAQFEFYDKEKLNNSYLLQIGLQNIFQNQEYITLEDVQNEIKNKTSITTLTPHSICGYQYLSLNKIFIKQNDCNQNINYGFLTKITGAKENETTLIIEEKSVYYTLDNEDNRNSLIVYKNTKQQDILFGINSTLNDNSYLNIDNYIDKAEGYQYIFQKKNKEYIFKEIKKI